MGNKPISSYFSCMSEPKVQSIPSKVQSKPPKVQSNIRSYNLTERVNFDTVSTNNKVDKSIRITTQTSKKNELGRILRKQLKNSSVTSRSNKPVHKSISLPNDEINYHYYLWQHQQANNEDNSSRDHCQPTHHDNHHCQPTHHDNHHDHYNDNNNHNNHCDSSNYDSGNYDSGSCDAGGSNGGCD